MSQWLAGSSHTTERRNLKEYLAGRQSVLKEKLDPSDLAPQFVPYFESGARIEVTTTYDNGEKYVRRGRVGITTGWKPAFLLVSRRGAMGSSDVLGARDVVTRVISK